MLKYIYRYTLGKKLKRLSKMGLIIYFIYALAYNPGSFSYRLLG
jgi:hypothetical protein